MNKKRYELIVAVDAASMTADVNEHIEKGWQVVEGLSVSGTLMQWMEYAPEIAAGYPMRLLVAYNAYGLADQVTRWLAKGWDMYQGIAVGNGYLFQWMVSAQDGEPAQQVRDESALLPGMVQSTQPIMRLMPAMFAVVVGAGRS